MIKKIIIPLYRAEQELFEEKKKENRNIKSYAAYALMKSGIRHYEEDMKVNFSQTISVPVYPSTDKVDVIYIPVNEDDQIYQYLEAQAAQLHLAKTKLARFFFLYDWRHGK